MWKQWLDKLLAIFSKTKLSEEELIAYGRQLEREELRKGYVQIYIDPTVRSYPQGGAYDNQGPITDRPTIIPNPRGHYFQEQRKSFEKTHLLPTFKRPPQDEPPMTLDMTQARIPTWLL